jgi:hypothetical protein
MTIPTVDGWRDALTGAFSILLGRPLREFDPHASYALYYRCSNVTDELFGLGEFNTTGEHLAGFEAEVLARGDVIDPPFPTIPAFHDIVKGWDAMILPAGWSFDLGRSVFSEYAEGGAVKAGVPELAAGLSGAELGRILVERGMTPGQLAPADPVVDLRVHTDGSLFDALRAATATLRGPDHLFDFSPGWGTDPEWDGPLDGVAHPGLRDHLRHLCRTEDSARSDGAYYVGVDNSAMTARRAGTLLESGAASRIVTSWWYGEGYAWSAVVQSPPAAQAG